jgi:hypothetical protein
MLSSGPGPVLPGVGASPSAPIATPGASPSAIPSALPSAAPSGSVEPSGASGSPTAAEIAAARDDVDTYTSDLKNGNTAAAWAMLAPEEQAKFDSESAWASERAAFFQGVRSSTVTVNPTDVEPIGSWLTGTNGAAIDLAHAVLVEVRYDLGGAPSPADWDLYIVAPRSSGGLEIFSVR